MNNIFRDATYSDKAETVSELLARPNLRIERITSSGQISDDWYDQDEDEWVILLTGTALLQIDGEKEPARLTAGDYLFPRACAIKLSIHRNSACGCAYSRRRGSRSRGLYGQK